MAYPYGLSFLGNNMGGAQGLRYPTSAYINQMDDTAGFQLPENPSYQNQGLKMPMAQSMPEMGGAQGLQIPTDFQTEGGITGGAGTDYTKGLTGQGAALLGLQMMQQSQAKPQAPVQVQNTIPQGHNMDYRNVMKMYGIKGLMG